MLNVPVAFFSSLTLACKEVNHLPVRYVQLGDKDDG